MQEIRLEQSRWFFDPQARLGEPGGFGAVYQGTSNDGRNVAVKQLDVNAEDSARRELKVAGYLIQQKMEYIIPILDSGQDSESGRFYVVMAIAERSLQDSVDYAAPFEEDVAVSILNQIASGLFELSGLVHRDLKPANVLLHEGRWKIADFGIARFVAESTAYRTLNDFLTYEYAAPEQWRGETPTIATDIYALGCIAHTLLSGSPPFAGPSSEEFRKQHLFADPPQLDETVSPFLSELVQMMLRKAPEARPSLERIRSRLTSIRGKLSKGSRSRLAEAAANIQRTRAHEEAMALAAAERSARREELAEQGRKIIENQLLTFRTKLLDECICCEENGAIVRLEKGIIRTEFSGSMPTVSEDSFSKSGFDVLLSFAFGVGTTDLIWESYLFYGSLPGGDQYRWHETSFYVIEDKQPTPTAFSRGFVPGYQFFDSLFAGTHKEIGRAFGPTPIDDEDEEEFFERWSTLFALAAEEKLKPPKKYPLEEKFWLTL
ncbi:serine/threonine-protein kinase [Terriglobus sp.]|uniref:serine/threonine-protein kinase n=1 Tax=Terriglobus sp. TaxID=1889013 RepID=UPI003B006E62